MQEKTEGCEPSVYVSAAAFASASSDCIQLLFRPLQVLRIELPRRVRPVRFRHSLRWKPPGRATAPAPLPPPFRF